MAEAAIPPPSLLRRWDWLEDPAPWPQPSEPLALNLASRDYLNLGSHPLVRRAAVRAEEAALPPGPGRGASLEAAKALEQRLADFLGCAEAMLFPSGWAAGYALTRSLAGPADHVVLDESVHACLLEGAANATRQVHAFAHLSNQALRSRLEAIRRADPQAGILVVTEALFATDGSTPDLRQAQALCRDLGATLAVGVAHDLGAMGETGRGMLEMQDMLGQVDVVFGSLSSVFGARGGFVAGDAPALKRAE